MGSHGGSRAGGSGSGGGGTSRPNITVSSGGNASSNSSYSEGAVFEKHINNLVDKLENTRSKNGAQRIVNSLENTKKNIQTHINTANFQIQQGNSPTENLASLKKAMGTVNRAITKARKKANSSPTVGAGGRPTKLR